MLKQDVDAMIKITPHSKRIFNKTNITILTAGKPNAEILHKPPQFDDFHAAYHENFKIALGRLNAGEWNNAVLTYLTNFPSEFRIPEKEEFAALWDFADEDETAI